MMKLSIFDISATEALIYFSRFNLKFLETIKLVIRELPLASGFYSINLSIRNNPQGELISWCQNISELNRTGGKILPSTIEGIYL